MGKYIFPTACIISDVWLWGLDEYWFDPHTYFIEFQLLISCKSKVKVKSVKVDNTLYYLHM